jgi:hypothetical protein
MESYRIPPPNCAFGKVLQLVVNIKVLRIETYSRQRDLMFQANGFRVDD